MAEPAPEAHAQARALLEQGISVRETAKATGLSKGQVEALRHRLAGERAALGLEPLPRAKPGPSTVDLGVSVPRGIADELDAAAARAGVDRREYVVEILSRHLDQERSRTA